MPGFSSTQMDLISGLLENWLKGAYKRGGTSNGEEVAGSKTANDF